jgi:hypothetical protein
VRSGLWERMADRVHPSVHLAVEAITGGDTTERPACHRIGLDERVAP